MAFYEVFPKKIRKCLLSLQKTLYLYRTLLKANPTGLKLCSACITLMSVEILFSVKTIIFKPLCLGLLYRGSAGFQKAPIFNCIHDGSGLEWGGRAYNWPSFLYMQLADIYLERALYWFVILSAAALLLLHWRKRLHRSNRPTHQALQKLQEIQNDNKASASDKAEAMDNLSAQMLAMDKQILQLKTQLEAKNKAFDYLMSDLLPKALAVENLKSEAAHLFQLVKSTQLTTYFNNPIAHELPTDFEQKLLATHPDLTEEELRLCAFIFLRLNTQQIANLKAISTAGVNKARTRLRKKMQLEAETDLYGYLIQAQAMHPS
ncbi:MAG: hypothetical protein Q8J69_00140 [Sphingobacteriaceae bacterium]|nr:hypothetical protein [Sphingobacteriaceae bacterium]